MGVKYQHLYPGKASASFNKASRFTKILENLKFLIMSFLVILVADYWEKKYVGGRD